MTTRVLLLSRYPKLGASSRYRSFQYIPYLEQHGFEITPLPLVNENYLHKRYKREPTSNAELATAYLYRIASLIKCRNFDLIWIEKEAFPYFPAWLERFLVGRSIPYVVDYDDAIFHMYDRHKRREVRNILGRKIDNVMRDSMLVLAGNPYLAQRAFNSGAKNVTLLPTVVNLSRYPHSPTTEKSRTTTFGWIGTPFTVKYLDILKKVIAEVSYSHHIKFTTIGGGPMEWTNPHLSILPWSEDTEVENLSKLDVGVMPLVDSDWERGKCGLKLIQYMASGLPVLASPVGVNVQIVEPGINGFLCSSEDEWIESMTLLASDPEMRNRLGQQGRRKVEEEFSLQSAAPKLAQALREASGQF